MTTWTCITQTALEYTAGSSDKLYIVQVQVDDSVLAPTYRTMGYYGRRGSALASTEKYVGPSISSANMYASKLEREKRIKGYTAYHGATIPGMPAGAPIYGGTSGAAASTASPAIRPIVGPSVMLAHPVDETNAKDYLRSQEWVVQKKYDGERVTVLLSREELKAFNRKGQVRPLTVAVEAELKKLLALPDFSGNRETIVDGELMGDEYIIYDIITLRSQDVKSVPYLERYAMLECLLETTPHLLAPTGWTADEKQELFDTATTQSWEGLMFREKTSAYVEGRSNSLLKYKLWATATCRVLTVNRQRSVEIALLDENGLDALVGNVTVPANQAIPEPDDLIEVRYLYCLPGGSLYQPTLLRIRNDISEADSIAQIRPAPPEKL